ncbi:MAG: type II toxin-antitoxin system RelE/ParE family toxin [Terracidiphilus sp.]
MIYPVHFTRAASLDLEEICDWIAQHDAPAKANHVLDRVHAVLESIAAMPHRGARPRELLPETEGDYRQLYFKPYRVIYEIANSKVIVHVIADGPRNLQSLLLRRLTSD